MRLLIALAFAGTLAFGQRPAFEVVSTKQAPSPSADGMRMGSSGGPGTTDPGHWNGENLSPSDLIHYAYNLKRHEYSGPVWMNDVRFDLHAKIPAATTKDDLRLMLQAMLQERFHLEFHREPKEMPGFELVVAKNGPELREAAPPPSTHSDAPPQDGPVKLGPDGYPVLSGGTRMAMINGRARWQNAECTAEMIANMLGGQTAHPVTDATGLKGKYNVSLYWASDNHNPNDADADPGPNIYTAIQEQLGLKLEPKKTTVQVLVADKADKLPTEN